jgi:hypothetical protein
VGVGKNETLQLLQTFCLQMARICRNEPRHQISIQLPSLFNCFLDDDFIPYFVLIAAFEFPIFHRFKQKWGTWFFA